MSSHPRYLIVASTGVARLVWFLILSLCPLLASEGSARAETVARCGDGWLEKVHGQLVLHVKGTPYEMGYQHGALLKQHCTDNLKFLLEEKAPELLKIGSFKINPLGMVRSIADKQEEFLPDKYLLELRGLAAAADLDFDDVRVANFIPELFHCSGFAVMNETTADGELYHGRVLDYETEWGLQDHAVIVVAEPDDGIPFVNVTYAGFVGSVTGMNVEQVSIGEMGGPGFGHWNGVPMAFLMREVIQSAKTLDEAKAVFEDNPRTCVYYYVIADGKTNQAIGLATNWEKCVSIAAGKHHRLLPRPVKDAVILSAGERYDLLVDRVESQRGKLDASTAIRLMDRPVAMTGNLHNVLFAPRKGDFWVAQAGPDGEPAATQPYHKFNLHQLLQRSPSKHGKTIPMLEASVE